MLRHFRNVGATLTRLGRRQCRLVMKEPGSLTCSSSNRCSAGILRDIQILSYNQTNQSMSRYFSTVSKCHEKAEMKPDSKCIEIAEIAHAPCPVCKSDETYQFTRTDHKIRYLAGSRVKTILSREFYHCQKCDACFVHPKCYISEEEETLRYAEHENDPSDKRYTAFLAKAVDPLLQDLLERHQVYSSSVRFDSDLSDSLATEAEHSEARRVMAHMVGLDFGCGPGPAIACKLGSKWGTRVINYDPVFFPNVNLADLSHKLDFVVCTEVLEHVKDPLQLMLRLLRLLKLPSDDPKGESPGGVLCLMTGVLNRKNNYDEGLRQGVAKLSKDHVDAFLSWSYTRDPTHIVFYQMKTIEHLLAEASSQIFRDLSVNLNPRIRQDPACLNVFLIDFMRFDV